ncbi:MAG: transglutaminase domain-containing protein, partial [Chloroflexota bacterium]|nr:transglutaminase domain-containing protein [Chloroflexota bacterium]
TFLDTQQNATDWLRETAGQTSGEGQNSAGSFSSFDDAFSVGGPLNLTDEPQALVTAEDAPYLAAQRYDVYSGRGWSSSAEETFDSEGPDGRTFAPNMTFQAGQEVVLSDDVTGERVPITVVVTPLGPAGDRLLTIESYLTADVDTSVRLSWTQLNDEPFSLREGSITALPADLQWIASLLVQADLQGEAGDGGPAATEPDLQRQIEDARRQLRPLFSELRWTAAADGSVETLFVTGQVPNYDDVEAVFGRDDVEPNVPYRVSGSASGASATELSRAGTEYPAWVAQRYLSLPDSITPRTAELARALTASSSGSYEKARAIEAYVRDTIVYDESVSAPPDNADIVDYVLFERQRGYCEYYASAMAVMLRTLGIPSRVAVGFFPGDYDDAQGGYVYLQRNAHAWVEVFFPAYGWIPFEPTSSQPLIEEGDVDATTIPTPSPVEEPLATEAISTPDPATENFPPPAPAQVTSTDDGNGNSWMLPTALLGVLLGGLALAVWALWALPLRGLSSTSALYTRLTALGRLVGLRQSPSATPREFGRSFGESVPQAKEHVRRIVHVYEVDQFGLRGADSGMLAAASHAWLGLRRNIWRWLFRRHRT